MEEKEQKKQVYCAIYTRKSTTEGLNQDFTSLDSQREAAENYINSQKHEGWIILKERYDDGGFTGANTDRPALLRMINDIKEGLINCVVVYKVDRLSRSLRDFAQLLELFETNNIAFVSVTQQFNTNTSMGRLTLNILLSFAQFKREITSERTKDKMSAARRRGQWVGGWVPLGYEVEKDTKKLIINPKEAQMIKEIYALYLEKGNTQLKVTNIINGCGWKTKTRVTKAGKIYGANKFTLARIQWILTNVTYIGKINFRGEIYTGQQEPVISEETFSQVQQKLVDNKTLRKAFKYSEHSELLKHLLKCKVCGSAMKYTYSFRKGRFKYRYYICSDAQKHSYSTCPNRSINALSIENETLNILKKILKEETIGEKMDRKVEISTLLSPEWDKLCFDEKYKVLRTLIKEIDCDAGNKKLGITLKGSNVRMEFDVEVAKSNYITRWHKEKEITKLPRILKSLLLAHQLQQLISKGQIKDLRQASGWLHISHSRLNHIQGLLFLSPEIQTEIIEGDPQKIDLIPEYKVISMVSEPSWDEQTKLWREIKRSMPAFKPTPTLTTNSLT